MHLCSYTYTEWLTNKHFTHTDLATREGPAKRLSNLVVYMGVDSLVVVLETLEEWAPRAVVIVGQVRY